MLKYILLIIILSFKSYALDINLIDINADNVYRGVKPWSGEFTDYSGAKWNVSNFYSSKSENFYIDTKFQIKSNGNYLGVLDFSFDNKYESDLFTVSAKFTIGLSNYFEIRDNFVLNFYTKTVFGGSINEKPCFDSFRREFHCGTGLAWTDYSSSEIKTNIEYNNVIGFFITKYF